MKPFTHDLAKIIINSILTAPESQLDGKYKKNFETWFQTIDSNTVSLKELWNKILEVRNDCVYSGLSSSFMIKLLSIDDFYQEP